jgi:hypothetical protein
MCVRIDKPRHDNASVRVEGRFVRIGGAQFRRGADRDDPFIAHDDRSIFDNSKCAEGVSALGAAGEGEELGGGVDEHFSFQ